MQVGVNYPWLDYGWDFGLGPPSWRGSRETPRWFGEIDRHLHHFLGLGITVVRWFILADGLTYGTGNDAPQPDPVPGLGWRFDPPPLAPDVLVHFEELLQRFTDVSAKTGQRVQLLPVLIDFHFCNPGIRPVWARDPDSAFGIVTNPEWVKGGRSEALTDPSRRTRFLDLVLDPLLNLSQRHPETIYAWDLINEPDWITKTWHPHLGIDHPIDERSMRAFLEEGKERIRRAGFKSTIGFGLLDTLRRSGITADINQFHHYPGGARHLERHAFDHGFPGIIGELATAASDIWPELRGTGQSLLNRLRLADALGYRLAIPWSFLAHDRHTTWSTVVEQDVRMFVTESGSRDSVAPP